MGRYLAGVDVGTSVHAVRCSIWRGRGLPAKAANTAPATRSRAGSNKIRNC